ncbi:small G protein signaling modulator 1 [Osmerus mordax]|uniref:small G protein signaling modulator 1 n=1 Tax=Osmerus mordax TaxID=8014 RepID=UPI00350E9599
MATAMAEVETRQRLLRTVKKEVKQIMEEAVTRKFVHEDSSHIVSFCAAVEACVLHGLKRRAAGFLRSNKIAALFTKVGKSFTPAEELCKKAQELEHLVENKRSQTLPSQDSLRRLPKFPLLSPQLVKHLWIRTALFEKVLDKIVLYLVENSSKFYEKEAVLMDPVDGHILASLLVGPCALEYTKMKTADHFWTDPSADELVQRHRIHSGHCRQDSPTKRPALCIQKRHSSSSMDERPSPSPSARDYVESLHQNNRATLLFGKNNVLVQPRDDMEAIPGYLSLHQTAEVMTLKWTPNQLMNGSVGDLDYEHSVYWDYAMTIRLEEIVYLHCHQQVDSGGTVVLVSQDGIQRPPLHFPRGGHLLQFLSCLENGLLPHGQLDPPLWSQRGKGKVFPKLRNRCPQGSADSVSDKEEDEATDYVFRILFPNSQSEFVTITPSPPRSTVSPLLARSFSLRPRGPPPTKAQTLVVPKRSQSCSGDPPLPGNTLPLSDLLDQGSSMWTPTARKPSCSSCSQGSGSDGGPPNGCNHERAPLKALCDNMKYQIISRAFYGWLAYCRHLSTVRTHLSALVNHSIVTSDLPCSAVGGLTTEVWERFLQDCNAYEERELLRLVYYGGVEPSLRREVWPFLLGHYQFTSSPADRKEVDEQVRACYEQTMSEWLGCEAIVRQREKEQHAVAIAKCSSLASVDSPIAGMVHRDSTVSNESSQSCGSDRQSVARLQSDSSSSTQVFESVEEVDQIETEPRSEEAKPPPKIPNGALQNGATSPDSGHPSSRNFSVTSGLSEGSLSTEDSAAPDATPRTTITAVPPLPPAAQAKSPGKAHTGAEGEKPNPEATSVLVVERGPETSSTLDKEEDVVGEGASEASKDTESDITTVPDLETDRETEVAAGKAADSDVVSIDEDKTCDTVRPAEAVLATACEEDGEKSVTEDTAVDSKTDEPKLVDASESQTPHTDRTLPQDGETDGLSDSGTRAAGSERSESSVESQAPKEDNVPAVPKEEVTSAIESSEPKEDVTSVESGEAKEEMTSLIKSGKENKTEFVVPEGDKSLIAGATDDQTPETGSEEARSDEPLTVKVAMETTETEILEEEAAKSEEVGEAIMAETQNEKVVTQEEEVVTQEEKVVAQEEKVVTQEEEVVTQEEKVVAQEEKVVTQEEKVVTKEEKVVTKEEKVVTQEEEVVTQEEKVVTKEEKVVTQEEKVVAQEEKVVTQEEEVVTQEEKVVAQEEKVVTQEEEVVTKEEKVVTKEEKVVTQEEEVVTQEEEVVIQEEKIVTQEEKVVTQEEEIVTQEEKVVTQEEKVVTQEEKVVTQEEEVVTHEEKVGSQEEEVVTQEEVVVTQEEKVVTQEEKVVTQEKKAVTQEEKCVTQEEEVVAQEEDVLTQEEEALTQEVKVVTQGGQAVTQEQEVVTQEEVSMNQEQEAVKVDTTEKSHKPGEETKTEKATMQSKSLETEKNLTASAETRVPRALECSGVAQSDKVPSATESDESPSAIEMEDIPTAKAPMASGNRKEKGEISGAEGGFSVPHLDLRQEEEQRRKASPEGPDSILAVEPESLFPQLGSLAVGSDLKYDATSPVPSIGTTYSQELLDLYTLNLHRIEKDVQRCDRNYCYFTPANLEKLRNIMCSYVWQHLEIGYVQGMCDLLAPLLVILDDEAMAFSCFSELMKRMNQNFPHGGAMDTHFANMRSLIQILDSELFELMHQNGDYTHFYFCYRWFLLDFKRELVYDDVFAVWETIWAAKYASSSHFVLFIALALVEIYRDIILENNMDFTDIIKFFNEMAEHHNSRQVLTLARDLVWKVQTLIENK